MGNRGMPVPRPPFPAIKGLWEKPTIINNVETWANIPVILTKGAEWFAKIGTETSKGTKVFALTGKVKSSGLVEVPMGTSLRDIVFGVGGGIKDGKAFKGAQTGGPSGGIITAENLDTPIDYEHLTSLGSMMGSGGLIVMDEDDCAVDVSRFYMDFCVDESCGKCSPCRIGTAQLLAILEKITKGNGTLEDLDKLEEIGKAMSKAALCALGQTAPNPTLSTLHYLRQEYLDHIEKKQCKSGKCKNLVNFSIDKEKCKGCSLCAKKCPANCISGDKTIKFTIDNINCVKCGECFKACKFSAVLKS
jgi:NADH-quinone oxidoreductase subunit F/NADP-reducing hydrogenase subunit HndC